MKQMKIENNNKAEIAVCETTEPHAGAVADVSGRMPEAETLLDLAEVFKVFGDGTRVRILYALFERELCVCDIAELLHMTVSAISHQLRILKQAELVTYRRDGKTVIYALKDRHVSGILGMGMEHIREGKENGK